MQSSPTSSGFFKESIYKLGEDIAKQLDYERNGEIESAIDKAGGTIEYRDPWDLEGGDSGSVVIEKLGKFIIYISTYTSANRDRFTVAHELGHYVLHYLIPSKKDDSQLGTMTCTRAGEGRVEWEANWFAAGFLMPKQAFSDIYDETLGDLESVAEYFGVSFSAAEIRAKALGKID